MAAALEAWKILRDAGVIFARAQIEATLDRLAREITGALGETFPLVLSVMGGAVVFTGQLLPRLAFPLEFDYLHASRYGEALAGRDVVWKALPRQEVKGRTVLVLDDILDEGHTLAAIRDKLLALGARAFYSAVFCEKALAVEKPIRADFTGLEVPNRYVFGFGMDVAGLWRNLPEVYAMR